ncbi:CDP-alcohol phosphatidyltransferase family protein [Glaciibacter flavus]|uniref:CDP-alcohol phosphatidyltransferase family protein n=1 Tax=Orlajensenia flava TaxID=2565934 RepID=UPI003AFFDFED
MSAAVTAKRPSFRQVVDRLEGAQKKRARGAPAYSIYVNRPVGRYLAAAAYLLGLSPNAISAISAGFTLCAIVLLAVLPPTILLGVVVWLLLAVGYALDSADGQVARLRGGGSPSGEWLDHVLDALKTPALHLAVLVTAYLHFGVTTEAWLLIPIGFSIVASVSFFAMILNDQLKARTARKVVEPPSSSTPLRALLGIPTDYGVICLAFLTLGSPLLFMVVYSVLFVANLGYLALALPKWYRDMRGLTRP